MWEKNTTFRKSPIKSRWQHTKHDPGTGGRCSMNVLAGGDVMSGNLSPYIKRPVSSVCIHKNNQYYANLF